jgi:hypothetical protein
VSARVNTYTASFTANDGVSDSQVGTVQITVSPAVLTITARSPTMLLHGTVPAITPSYSGFVNGDSAASHTTPPTCTTTAVPVPAQSHFRPGGH